MTQEIKEIPIKELVLWTENPRDPVDINCSDGEIAERAISTDGRSKWSLEKLFKTMGTRFDQSEIPTVAYVDGKPIVYDGNRRILIGKIINGYVTVENCPDFSKFEFPDKVPCNVCDQRTALEHVDRKHAESGSWNPLERDIFKSKHMNVSKSTFLIIEESTKIISTNPKMNQRFVKEEIFDDANLVKLGFLVNDDELKHAYKKEEDGHKILDKVIEIVDSGEISTRKNRGNIEGLLKKDNDINAILNNKSNEYKSFISRQDARKTRTVKGKRHTLFGSKLSLKSGTVNNIYSDILKLFEQKNKQGYSDDFPMLIRMGMRLLCELAFKENWNNHLEKEFSKVKKQLSTDEKTTLHSQNVNKNNIVGLIQLGAHDYTASNNIEQTIAISLVLGVMLKDKHGK